MLLEWKDLPDLLQVALCREALIRAAATIARQAEVLADEIDGGTLPDRGGAEALRLFAAVVRAGEDDGLAPAGLAESARPWPEAPP